MLLTVPEQGNLLTVRPTAGLWLKEPLHPRGAGRGCRGAQLGLETGQAALTSSRAWEHTRAGCGCLGLSEDALGPSERALTRRRWAASPQGPLPEPLHLQRGAAHPLLPCQGLTGGPSVGARRAGAWKGSHPR